ncbi:hypothetical protein FH608_046455 [Nonomuraea phyllanthi]|uniref:Uncharacterized protein n=1 Tax=Nonomuraea phyllanthi TaxID=2219224 RepID=A0A5C4V7E7_9ACTN|nr:hypothetical protein [Nonomuraea phyllanthi]KAB8186935.1 hypothetical protein FH608_046455 [Nonomuraea phyllanthi]
MSDFASHPMIDVWAVLSDPDIPSDVGQRLLTRQRARALGLTPDVVPEEDKPFLARHIVPAPDPTEVADA